ncbi:xanthine dehydrogenase YagS FAD-binding subunit [Ancylobacter aquaticus]|uniref:Xanthine dehydrogenase YagS FAD-binding subunit n=1 Tax=Ancylobacter aquaticus TaxID=100 RepID=A0A4R1I5X8_ANCAQ|nr:xanthine dehydrogenase family protein subunit M [Ancylobacter aquaticus]TCK30757.1 xanthine dehydrogenase YagS FAD-binding subunit [Ancylobacter aquaticus]
MRPFHYSRPPSMVEAVVEMRDVLAADPHASATFLAGGTTVLDLMKLEVMQPSRVIDLTALRQEFGYIRRDGASFQLGAFASMAEVAAHPDIIAHVPVIAQSLSLAASAQLRNMASLGGNVLQRTRCAYFRDPSWGACNKRVPGSGCAALEGANRAHAVLGTSAHCIATYPGDFAQALLALDATIVVVGPRGSRTLPFAALHRLPGTTPHLETHLHPGEIIAEFIVPAAPWARRSLYLKIRDRQSYEFAVASVAVALDIDGGTVREARIALGGVASVPWRAGEAEAALQGLPLSDESARTAAAAAFADATPHAHNAFKVALGQSTLVRALLQVASMEPAP